MEGDLSAGLVDQPPNRITRGKTWRKDSVSAKLVKLVKKTEELQKSKVDLSMIKVHCSALKFTNNAEAAFLFGEDHAIQLEEEGTIWTEKNSEKGSSSSQPEHLTSRNKLCLVLQVCGTVGSFWQALNDLSKVCMLACVCKGTREVFQPTENTLPFWGVWSKHIGRRHEWKEFNRVMDVKREDLTIMMSGGNTDCEDTDHEDCEKAEEYFNLRKTKKRRGKKAKTWKLEDIWRYMVDVKHNGSVSSYAKSIKKYRRFQWIHVKRQMTYASRVMKELEDRKVREEEHRILFKKKTNELQDVLDALHAKESRILKGAFVSALCCEEEGGMLQRIFCSPQQEEYTEREIRAKIWDTMVHVSESVSNFMNQCGSSSTLSVRNKVTMTEEDMILTRSVFVSLCIPFLFCASDTIRNASDTIRNAGKCS